MANHPSTECLEQALNLWEDYCFVMKKMARFLEKVDEPFGYPIDGPLVNAPQFREVLLKQSVDYLEFGRFIPESAFLKELGDIAWLPTALFAWTRNSRKVYHLPCPIQTAFSGISLKDICWKDIKWPFESFLLTLEDPIVDTTTGHSFNGILVSNMAKALDGWIGVYNFHFFSAELSQFHKMSSFEKERFIKWIKTGEGDKVIAKVDSIDAFVKGKFVESAMIAVDKVMDDRLNNIDEGFKQTDRMISKEIREKFGRDDAVDEYEDYSLIMKGIHIVANLCLYLYAFPAIAASSPRQKHTNEGKKASVGRKAITDKAEIFTITSENFLTAEDYRVIDEIKRSRASHQKCIHWRRGHWRKEPGKGHILDAPKSILVKPTLVNDHLILEGLLPGGSKTTLV